MQQMKNLKVCSYIFPLCLLCISAVCWGQSAGSIAGTVTDSTGASVVGTTVSAIQESTRTTSTAVANQSGAYIFPSLQPSTYTLSISAPGFQSFVQKGVLLQANQAMTVNIKLQVGSISQVVSVSGSGTQVDTTTSTVSQVIGEQQVNELPLNGRNAAQLTTLVAGVVLAPNDNADQGATKTFPVAVTISANGSRADQTNYLLDGGNNVDEYTNVNGPFPFPDALQEFSVQTSNYNAEYGQNSGGVVNIVTKSGGTAFHGNAFEYLRNGLFNARNYFATTVDPLKRNQFGGTFGGPVTIPHISTGKHSFFFFGYQHTIVHDLQGGVTAYVPTDANRQGDYSALLSATDPDNPLGKVIHIIDPQTGLPFPNNMVSRTDPAAASFESHLPHATGNGRAVYQQPLNQGFNEFVGRFDQDLSVKDHILARYYYNDFTSAGVVDPSNLLTYTDQSNIRFQNALLSDTHTFTANLLNSLIVNYTKETSLRGPLDNAPDVGDFGVNIYQPPMKALQQITVSGFLGIGDQPLALFQRNNVTIADDFHWVRGNHNFAFGVHAEISKIDVNNQSNLPGAFTFNSNNTGYALASLQLGYLYQFIQASGQYMNIRNHFLGFYGQDSWKVSQRLTLNYGIRYEPFYPWNEIMHRIERFDPSAYADGRTSTVYVNAPKGLLFPGDAGMPDNGIKNGYAGVMPRVGFAWDVYGDGKISLRGGSGIFYDTRIPGIYYANFTNLTPFILQYNQIYPSGPFSDPYRNSTNPFPAPYPPAKTVSFPSPVQALTFDPSGTYHVPVTYNWNLVLENQIANNLLLRIAYVGSHQSNLLSDLELNPSVYIPNSSLSTNQRRPYQGYSNITEANMGANESYQSLQGTLEQRLSKGVTVLMNYTWSKALDTLPYGATLNALKPSTSYVYPYTMPNFKSLDIGPSDFDRRSVLSASYVWQLPILKRGDAALRAVINHWQTSGIVAAQSGAPLTITAGQDISSTGLNQDRAVLTGASIHGMAACANTSSSCVNWLNSNAFALPKPGQFGDIRKGAFRGPGYFNWDISLARDFPIISTVSLRFRAEYFNVTNHADFSNPTTSVSTAGFGNITSTGNNQPRIGQMSVKIQF